MHTYLAYEQHFLKNQFLILHSIGVSGWQSWSEEEEIKKFIANFLWLTCPHFFYTACVLICNKSRHELTYSCVTRFIAMIFICGLKVKFMSELWFGCLGIIGSIYWFIEVLLRIFKGFCGKFDGILKDKLTQKH